MMYQDVPFHHHFGNLRNLKIHAFFHALPMRFSCVMCFEENAWIRVVSNPNPIKTIFLLDFMSDNKYAFYQGEYICEKNG